MFCNRSKQSICVCTLTNDACKWLSKRTYLISVPPKVENQSCLNRSKKKNKLYVSRKTFRRRVLQKIVGVCHTMHVNKHHSAHIFWIRIHSTRILSIRIPQIRIHSIRKIIRIHSKRLHSKGMHQQEWECICEYKTYPCISMHQQEWQCVWMQNISLHIIASAGMAMTIKSLHVISYHCYSAGMANKKPCTSFNFFATFLLHMIVSRVWTCKSGMGGVNRKSALSLKRGVDRPKL